TDPPLLRASPSQSDDFAEGRVVQNHVRSATCRRNAVHGRHFEDRLGRGSSLFCERIAATLLTALDLLYQRNQMALIDDMFKGDLAAGLALGVGAIIFGPNATRAMGSILRPAAK